MTRNIIRDGIRTGTWIRWLGWSRDRMRVITFNSLTKRTLRLDGGATKTCTTSDGVNGKMRMTFRNSGKCRMYWRSRWLGESIMDWKSKSWPPWSPTSCESKKEGTSMVGCEEGGIGNSGPRGSVAKDSPKEVGEWHGRQKWYGLGW